MRTAVLIVASIVLIWIAGYVALARSGFFELTRADLIERYAGPESKFVNIKGIEVHYKDEGAGTPVVLFHGSFGSVHTWDGIANELVSDYRVIRMDQPQSALSSDIDQENEGLLLEDFVATFLDEVGVDKAHFIGTSSGGIIAYRFASKYPHRTGALIIANAPSAVVDNDAIETPLGLKALTFFSQHVLKYQPRIYWNSFLKSLYAEPSRLNDKTVNQYYDFGWRSRTAPYVRSMFARVNDTAEIDQVLSIVTSPTLLLWGTPDRVLPEEMGYQLQRKLVSTDAELVMLNGTGHYPPVESPLIVSRYVEAFLSEYTEPSTLP